MTRTCVTTILGQQSAIAHERSPMRDLAKEPEAARRALETMWTARRFEEAVDQLFARGLMHGTMHLSIGQEASATGTCLALRDDDLITSTHRGHSHCVAKGADLTRMMAELLAKDSGYCRGGGGIPIAVGAALAQKLTGSGKVVVSFFGDGAANEGAFHEAANLAAVWDLPVVFVCENNHYGMSMAADEAFAIDNISARAGAYGFPGVTVDGNDLQAVYEMVTTAAERARAGRGPTLVENVTYRWKGHSKSDKNLYRTREEIAAWQERDPITRFEDAVRKTGSLTDPEITAARKAATDAVREAIRTANAAPAAPADRDLLLDAVYADADAGDPAEVPA